MSVAIVQTPLTWPVGVEERELHEHELALGLAVAAGDRRDGPRSGAPVVSTSRSRSSVGAIRDGRQHLGRRAADRGARR